jgi:hypothetical protein
VQDVVFELDLAVEQGLAWLVHLSNLYAKGTLTRERGREGEDRLFEARLGTPARRDGDLRRRRACLDEFGLIRHHDDLFVTRVGEGSNRALMSQIARPLLCPDHRERSPVTAPTSPTAARRAVRHLSLVAERAGRHSRRTRSRRRREVRDRRRARIRELFLPSALAAAAGQPRPRNGTRTRGFPAEGAEEAVPVHASATARVGAPRRPAELDLAAPVAVPGGGTVALAEWIVAWDVHTSGLLGVASEAASD